jgi:hypothetical protein
MGCVNKKNKTIAFPASSTRAKASSQYIRGLFLLTVVELITTVDFGIKPSARTAYLPYFCVVRLAEDYLRKA